MGRGRAKAKQTKVARALKYYAPNTDLSALEQELHGSPDQFGRYIPPDNDAESTEDSDDDYGNWASNQH